MAEVADNTAELPRHAIADPEFQRVYLTELAKQ
jgi:hypothetical protein